jgi:hypothetical protein
MRSKCKGTLMNREVVMILRAKWNRKQSKN